jgi:hypothetical protein
MLDVKRLKRIYKCDVLEISLIFMFVFILRFRLLCIFLLSWFNFSKFELMKETSLCIIGQCYKDVAIYADLLN